MSSVSKTDDRRVAIDITILKQSCGLVTRWCLKELMLAAGPTNGQMDPADLLCSALHVGEYQLRAETSVLDQKRRMRDERDRRKFKQIQTESQLPGAKQPENDSQFSAPIRAISISIKIEI